MNETVDLMKLIEAGGCSAKLPAGRLKEIISEIPVMQNDNLLVGYDSSDDALVYAINKNTAIIQTTDFFPPVCPNPYDFGQIAAANALSDIYAMGGTPVTALNIVMFPSAELDQGILRDILKGGADKVMEAGAVLAGGHTIDGAVPVYGLSVTGIIHPDDVLTNSSARPGDKLVLIKAVGTGVISAGKRIDEAPDDVYTKALESMKQLNQGAVPLMKKYNVRCATDVTGFSLAGHALEVARGSGATLVIETQKIPLLDGVLPLLELGCIPGASFRNLKYIEPDLKCGASLDYNLKMAAVDAQTSGGLLVCIDEKHAARFVLELIDAGYDHASVIGEVTKKHDAYIELH